MKAELQMSSHLAELRVATPDPEQWDHFVASISGDMLVQTAAWARTKAPRQRHEIVGLYEGERLVGGCMLLVRRLGPIKIAYAPRGPIVAPGYEWAFPRLVDELTLRIPRRQPSALVVQPTQLDALATDALTGAGFTDAPIEIAPSASVEIDLAAEPEAILARMRSSTRASIRKAERRGVDVQRGDKADLATFQKLHALTAARQEFTPFSLDYLSRQWDGLSALQAVRVYIAYLEGRPLAAATVTAFGDRMVYKLTGLSEDPDARRISASAYLQWSLLCAARADGFSFYDFGGLDREAALIIEGGGEPPEEFRKSASQFKLGFGGNVVTGPQAMWRLGPGPVRFGQGPLLAAFDRSPALSSRLAGLRSE